MSLAKIRQEYHRRICADIIRIKRNKAGAEYPNFADGDNRSSIRIAWRVTEKLNYTKRNDSVKEQTVGKRFETITKDFLIQAFGLLSHLRPGNWQYFVRTSISSFVQYEHLAYLETVLQQDKALSAILGGDYIVKPDIVIARWPVADSDINVSGEVIPVESAVANLTPFRESNQQGPRPLLHASISCKWTIRSDRSQNTRTEALNLIRNRKGHLPHIVAVTAEPLPTRIAALALGTGDLDCVYHFALPELEHALRDVGNEDQLDMLLMLIEGQRLRDIGDLPLDLAA